MTMKVTLSLNDTVYERAKLLAQLQQQDVAKALAHWLDETLPPAEIHETNNAGVDGPDDLDVEAEMQAYIALHQDLVRKHKDQFVAVHKGQLVDYDDDYGALLARIEAAYPNRFVWITKVAEQPIRQLAFRSPRLTKGG